VEAPEEAPPEKQAERERHSCLGFGWVLGSGVWGLGVRVSGFRCRVQAPEEAPPKEHSERERHTCSGCSVFVSEFREQGLGLTHA